MAAVRVAERLGRDATVITIIVDSGLKYLSTEVYEGLSDRRARIVPRIRRDALDT